MSVNYAQNYLEILPNIPQKKNTGKNLIVKLVIATDSDRLPPKQYALPAPFGELFKK